MVKETLYRYKDIIPDFDTFLQAIKSRRITTVRWNPHKVARRELIEELKECFAHVESISWYKDGFRLGYVEKPGKTLYHALGHYYIQEESAMAAALALAPKKHSLVLDMCAAPGGKTTQLSALMENTGTVVANDKAIARLKSLVANVSRLACVNVIVSWNDATKLDTSERFDYVLVDAPCTAEGNLQNKITLMPRETRETLSSLQKALLKKACELTKPNGTIVYCTCTFAPEENERVVAAILEEQEVKIEKIGISVPHEKGLESFGKEFYGEELKKAIRIYPHHLNSGGAFIAKLKKKG